MPGKVIIQTYNPTNYVYESVVKNDFDEFFNYEMNIRKKLSYPPYYYICDILVTSSDFNTASDGANKVKKYLDSILSDDYIILGPSVSSIVKLNNKYRFNIMIKYKKSDKLYEALSVINNIEIKNVNVDININI